MNLCVCCQAQSTIYDHLLCSDCWHFTSGQPKRIRRRARAGNPHYQNRLVTHTQQRRREYLEWCEEYTARQVAERELALASPIRLAIGPGVFIPLVPGRIEGGYFISDKTLAEIQAEAHEWRLQP